MTCLWQHPASKNGDTDRVCGKEGHPFCTEHQFVADVLEETESVTREISGPDRASTLAPEVAAAMSVASRVLFCIRQVMLCVKQRVFQWRRAGCPNSLWRGRWRASFIYPRRWQYKKNHRSRSAGMPRTGIRTVGRRRQTRNCAVHVGIEDSVPQHQQESLQGLAENMSRASAYGTLLCRAIRTHIKSWRPNWMYRGGRRSLLITPKPAVPNIRFGFEK
jgi:hypothetical protein